MAHPFPDDPGPPPEDDFDYFDEPEPPPRRRIPAARPVPARAPPDDVPPDDAPPPHRPPPPPAEDAPLSAEAEAQAYAASVAAAEEMQRRWRQSGFVGDPPRLPPGSPRPINATEWDPPDRRPRPGRRPGQPASRFRLDWAGAAQLLARGLSVREVAAAIGCHRVTVWHALKRSPGLRAMIAETRARDDAQAGAALRGIKTEVAEAIKRLALAEKPDARVLLWLADRVGLAASDYFGIPETPQRPLDRLRLHRLHFAEKTLSISSLEGHSGVASRSRSVASVASAVALTAPPDGGAGQGRDPDERRD
jgi:hypothetical protein